MVALNSSADFFSENALSARRKNHRHRTGASVCSKLSTSNRLRRANYDEITRLESCSKDPIGYAGSGMNLTRFCRSMPLSRVDPSGKRDYCFAEPPSCCDLVRARAKEIRAGAAVVCCKGYKMICVWEVAAFPDIVRPDWAEEEEILNALEECTISHEKVHEPHGDCRKDGVYIMGPRMGGPGKAQSECLAYTVQIQCLEAKREQCSTERCRQIIEAELVFYRAKQATYCREWLGEDWESEVIEELLDDAEAYPIDSTRRHPGATH